MSSKESIAPYSLAAGWQNPATVANATSVSKAAWLGHSSPTPAARARSCPRACSLLGRGGRCELDASPPMGWEGDFWAACSLHQLHICKVLFLPPSVSGRATQQYSCVPCPFGTTQLLLGTCAPHRVGVGFPGGRKLLHFYTNIPGTNFLHF